jgi:predicted type IV restriction endonuclease
MLDLNLPTYDVRLKGDAAKPFIFDRLRRKYVALTPEEWVRQHFVNFLINHKGYPASLLANEVKLQMGHKTLRADSVLYGNDLRARMIIEYKAPSVAITEKVFHQIGTYNLLLGVDYMVVSNGLEHYCCKATDSSGKFTFLNEIPEYSRL